jgi:hypothetical protein
MDKEGKEGNHEAYLYEDCVFGSFYKHKQAAVPLHFYFESKRGTTSWVRALPKLEFIERQNNHRNVISPNFINQPQPKALADTPAARFKGVIYVRHHIANALRREEFEDTIRCEDDALIVSLQLPTYMLRIRNHANRLTTTIS